MADPRTAVEIARLADPVALLEALFASAPMPLQIYEASGRSVLVNQAFRDTYGAEPPPDYNVFRDEVAAGMGVTGLIERAFAGEQITTPPHWYDPRGLDHVRVEVGRRVGQVVTMTPLRDRSGAVTHVAVFVKDVTSELAEQARSAAERTRLGAIIDVSASLNAVLDDQDTAAKVARLLVPNLADMCTMFIADDAGQLIRVTEAAEDPEVTARLHGMRTLPAEIARVLMTGPARLLPDYPAFVRELVPASDPYRVGLEAVGLGAGIAAPLIGRARVIGLLAVGTLRRTGRAFAAEDVALLGVLGERIGVALENGRLFAAATHARAHAEENNRINAVLVRLAGSFARERDERQVLRLATDEATALIGADMGAMFFNVDDPAGGQYMLHVVAGPAAAAFAGMRLPRATELFGPIFRGEAPIRLDDVTADPRFGRMGAQPPGHPPVTSFLAVPVVARTGAVLGGLFFGHAEPARFTALHERLIVGLASQAATALENARLYEALRASDERARTAVQRKDEFLAILGHELRNPLAPIVTAVELMKLRDGAGVVERERTVIERQVTHLSRLVDDLLDLSRITSGKVVLDRRRVELAVVVAEAVERVSPLLEKHGHHLRVDVPGASLAVDGDPDRLAQVITNLLHNAAKYTPPGGHIELRAARAGDAIAIEVRDDGQGIERATLDAIFELFVQGTQALQRPDGGLGIGLALVKHLVGMHGGTVTADSAGKGQGSVFRVTLPAAPANTQPAVRSPSDSHEIAGPARRVLIVDDNVDAGQILAEVLAEHGHDVRVAADGVQGLALAAELRPEIAILDIGLPVMDGYELAGRLRALLAEPVRLIALTGYGQEEDRARGHAAGFDAYLVKPATMRDVLRSLHG